MRHALLVYSRTGNNRQVAAVLAARLAAPVEEVRPKGWYNVLRLGLDLLRHHRPRIHPLGIAPETVECLIVVAPVWGFEVAHPMQAALARLNGRIGRYVFVTLCGMGRDEQEGKLAAQLTDLVGHAPDRIVQIAARDLVPEARRDDVRAVSAYRLDAAGLDSVRPRIEALAAAL